MGVRGRGGAGQEEAPRTDCQPCRGWRQNLRRLRSKAQGWSRGLKAGFTRAIRARAGMTEHGVGTKAYSSQATNAGGSTFNRDRKRHQMDSVDLAGGKA